MTDEKRVIITDPNGQLMSHDRLHLTNAGAIFIAEKIKNYELLDKGVLELLDNDDNETDK